MAEASEAMASAVATRLPEGSIVREDEDGDAEEEEVVTRDTSALSFWTLGIVGAAAQKVRRHKRSSSSASDGSSLGIGDEAIDEIVSSVLAKDGEIEAGGPFSLSSLLSPPAGGPPPAVVERRRSLSLQSKTLSTNSLLKKSAEQAKAITETASKKLADKLAILEESFTKAMREKDKEVSEETMTTGGGREG